MSRIHALASRVEKIAARYDQQRASEQDGAALALITASLVESIERFSAGLPVERERYTPAEQAIIDRFSRRYNATGARDELLERLSAMSEGQADE